MPVAVWTVIRFPPNFSRDIYGIPVLTTSTCLSTPHQWFTFVRLLNTHLTWSLPCLFPNANHLDSLSTQLRVVWYLLLKVDTGGPPSIFCTALNKSQLIHSWHTVDVTPPTFVAHRRRDTTHWILMLYDMQISVCGQTKWQS